MVGLGLSGIRCQIRELDWKPLLLQGNTQGKRARLDAPPDEHMPAGSPPTSPGSPLTYSPQVAMEPIPQQGATLGRDHAAEFHGVSGWPAQPKLVPTVIVCEYSSCLLRMLAVRVEHPAWG